MMILNVDGEVLSYNASARDIILTDGNVDKHVADIRRQVLSSESTRWSGDGAGSSLSKTPIAQLLVSQGTRWYGLRGFWLEAPSDSGSSLIGVVIEQINLRRLDMHQSQRLYRLSPREISVITALAHRQNGQGNRHDARRKSGDGPMVSKEHSNQDGGIDAYRDPTEGVLHANGSVACYVSTTGVTRTNFAVELP